MNKMNKYLTIIALFVLTGCAGNKTVPNVQYVAVDLPTSTIETKANETTSRDVHSRVSIGVYRPTVDVASMLNESAGQGTVLRNVDVVLQTPFCVPPIICSGNDTVVFVAE